jgi:hypothetical protein
VATDGQIDLSSFSKRLTKLFDKYNGGALNFEILEPFSTRAFH